MKFTTISVGLIATLSTASAGLINLGSGECSFNIATQLTNILHLGQADGNHARCGVASNGTVGGIVSGLAGFTTQGGDALQVIESFAKTANYKGEFDSVLSAVKQSASEATGAVTGLDGYCDAWTKASSNPDFYTSQVQVATSQLKAPVDSIIGNLGIVNSLTKSVLYDTALLHGTSDVTGVLQSLIKTTNLNFVTDTVSSTASNVLTLASGVKVDELTWILGFLDARKGLNVANDADNIDLYRAILGEGILNFGKGGLLQLNLSTLHISDLLKGVLAVVAGLVDSVEDVVDGVLNGVVSGVQGAVNGVEGQVLNVANGAVSGVEGVVGGLLGPEVGGVVNSIVGGVEGAVVPVAAGAINAVSGVVTGAVGTVEGAVGTVNGVVDGAEGVVGGVGGAVDGVVGTVTGVVNTVGALVTINCNPIIQL
ncbi:hypothetical protein IWW50_000187 [Coemansia erecta]|nr:hypothetical protein IWW50_000187 [Coemansia erecta]